MPSLDNLLQEMDERTIARLISTRHDEARMRFHLSTNTVSSFEEFTHIIGNYYNYHFTTCISRGGNLSSSDSDSRAKELLEREYRRQDGDIVSAYNDAHDGTNGGMRSVLDIIADGLKAESVERYLRDVFDRNIKPNSWSQKVEIISQLLSFCGHLFSNSIRLDQPERYAQNYQDLIRSYIKALQKTSSIFRRL